MKLPLSAIRHNQPGFVALAGLHAQTKDCFLDDVEIDMQATDWLDADMCAAFGAILYRMEDNLNTVRLTNIQSGVRNVLSKNGFLSHYGRTKMPDHWGTTVSYKRFDADDDRYFASYIEDEFIQRSELPEMSTGLQKKFRESIFEIFSNAVLHSRTKLGIFSCGQFFPNRLNGGSLQIVSDAGYWRRKGRKNKTARLQHAFPGTVVSVEINTADRNSYKLSSEPETDDIF